MNKYLICERESTKHEWSPVGYFCDSLWSAQKLLFGLTRNNKGTQFTIFVCENIIDRCHETDHAEGPKLVKERTQPCTFREYGLCSHKDVPHEECIGETKCAWFLAHKGLGGEG